MFELPNLESCTTFPLPEGTNLEFKLGFNSSMSEKIIATLCAILNSGGGYLIIGIEDTTRRIVGIKSDKCMDNFLLMLDSIYHHNHIKKKSGIPIPIGTITSRVARAAEDKEILIVTLIPEQNEIYTVKDGTVWYRLAASNFKQTTLPTIYTEKEFEIVLRQKLAAQANVLYQQFDIEKKAINQRYKREQEKLRIKFKDLEGDFRRMIGAAKEAEQAFNEFREIIHRNILTEKSEVEKAIDGNKKSWFACLCCL